MNIRKELEQLRDEQNSIQGELGFQLRTNHIKGAEERLFAEFKQNAAKSAYNAYCGALHTLDEIDELFNFDDVEA